MLALSEYPVPPNAAALRAFGLGLMSPPSEMLRCIRAFKLLVSVNTPGLTKLAYQSLIKVRCDWLYVVRCRRAGRSCGSFGDLRRPGYGVNPWIVIIRRYCHVGEVCGILPS